MRVSTLEKIFPPLCVFIAFLFLTPLGPFPLSFSGIVAIHLISYLALGIFFELPELGSNVLCLILAVDQERLNKHKPLLTRILKIRYLLTHFVGPLTGIMAVASGIFLTERGGHSFQEGWLFWILFAASIGLYKGMYQHNAYLKNLLKVYQQGDFHQLRKCILSPFDQSLIFLELPTYIFIYWTASVKPYWFNPLKMPISKIEDLVGVWLAGIVLLILGSWIFIPLRWTVKHFSRISC